MSATPVSNIASLTETEVRTHFQEWINQQQEKGLTDIKFALNVDGNSTVVDVLRQIMYVDQLSNMGLLSSYHD